MASRDGCCRVYTLEQVEGYAVPTLAGHKQTLVASFFAGMTPGCVAKQCKATTSSSVMTIWEILPGDYSQTAEMRRFARILKAKFVPHLFEVTYLRHSNG